MMAEFRDLSHATVLVTGSTDGIGRATAMELAGMGARTLVHGRDAGRVASAVQAVRRATGNESVDGLVADFASLAEVRRLADDVIANASRLDVLINNAGVYVRRRELSKDGYELTFAVNHLAPFLLTNLLRPLLEESAPARVVTVSSIAHYSARLDLSNLQSEHGYDGYDAYALSKLCNVLFTTELADRLAGTGVTANSLHPGIISTKLLTAGFPGSRGTSVAQGAATPVYLAASPDVAQSTGLYFADREPRVPNPLAQDRGVRRRLWELSAGLVGLPLSQRG